MNRKLFFGTMGLTILLLTFLMNPSFSFSQTDEEVTITGVVVAIEWDEDDNVVNVAISVTIIPENEEEEEYIEDYIVGENDNRSELIKLIGETVEVTGTVEADEDGIKTIYVSSFERIK